MQNTTIILSDKTGTNKWGYDEMFIYNLSKSLVVYYEVSLCKKTNIITAHIKRIMFDCKYNNLRKKEFDAVINKNSKNKKYLKFVEDTLQRIERDVKRRRSEKIDIVNFEDLEI